MVKPKYSLDAVIYKGITIILSKPSRFDKGKLLSGYAGQLFLKYLHPLTLLNLDLRTLKEHLELYNGKFRKDTKVVILCDQLAIDKLLHTKGSLNDLRGNVYSSKDLIYIPTYAPQNAVDMKNWEYPKDTELVVGEEDIKNHGSTQRKNYKYWLYRDIHKAIRIAQNGVDKYSKFNITNPCSIENIIPILSCAEKQTWFLDIETTPNYSLTVISLGCMETKNIYTIPFYSYTKETFYPLHKYHILLKVLALSFKRNRWVAHNAMFDFFILAWRFKIPPPFDIYDTMLARHRIEPEPEKSLGHCISEYLDLPYHKDDGIFEPKNHWQEKQLWDYNARDVETTMLLYDVMQDISSSDARLSDSIARGQKFLRPFLLSSLMGLRINREDLTSERRRLEKLYNQYQRVVNKLVGYELNINSPKQVAEYLYECKGFGGKSKIKKDTDSKTLIKLLAKYNVPVCKVILRMRRIAKDCGVLDFAGWGSKGDRFTTSMNPSGTKTMRNSSNALLGFKKTYHLENGRQVTCAQGYGSNVQNITKNLRKFFIPDPGKILVNADQAGAEALIVAYLTREGRYRKLFHNNVKPHSFIAMHVFAKEFAKHLGMKFLDYSSAFLTPKVEVFIKHPRWRELAKLIKDSDGWEGKRYYYLGKKTCHASNYGMGVNTFIESILKETNGAITLTKKEAKSMLDMYFLLFPEIEEWHVNVKKQLVKDATLYNLFGDRRKFYDHPSDSLYRDAYSWVPQSTVGVLTNIGISRLQDKIEQGYSDVDFLNNVHDSMMVQCKIGNELPVAKMMCGLMAYEFTTPYGEFTMKSEAQVGYDWKNMEDVEI